MSSQNQDTWNNIFSFWIFFLRHVLSKPYFQHFYPRINFEKAENFKPENKTVN